MSKVLVASLKKLLDGYPEPLVASSLTKAQKRSLDEFASDTRSVQAVKKGRGVVYQVIEIDVVKLRLHKLMPAYNVATDVPQRAANLAKARNTKQGKASHDRSYILLKTVNNPRWFDGNQSVSELHENTRRFGVCSLEIGGEKNSDLFSKDSIWLVENQALFDQMDWLPTNEAVTVIWYRGQLHNKLIDWLSSSNRAPLVYVFADYDGVGLNNYRRLRDSLVDRAKFWIMPEWRHLLNSFGQNELWQSTSNDFELFIKQSNHWLYESPQLLELVTEMQKKGLALEQESVWLTNKI